MKKKAKACDEIAKGVKRTAVLGIHEGTSRVAVSPISRRQARRSDERHQSMRHRTRPGRSRQAAVGRVDKVGHEHFAKWLKCSTAFSAALSYGDFGHVATWCGRAVVENPRNSAQALAEVEAQVGAGAILTPTPRPFPSRCWRGPQSVRKTSRHALTSTRCMMPLVK